MGTKVVARDAIGFTSLVVIPDTMNYPRQSTDVIVELKIFDHDLPDVVEIMLRRLDGQGKISGSLEELLTELETPGVRGFVGEQSFEKSDMIAEATVFGAAYRAALDGNFTSLEARQSAGEAVREFRRVRRES